MSTKSVRRRLESFVVAYNKILLSVVSGMSDIILLRNAHPSYRVDFAYEMRDEGLITNEELQEFIKRK